jgi:ferredoxin
MNFVDTRVLPQVDTARCSGCGWCVAACPFHLLSLEVRNWKKSSVLGDAGNCTGCGDCALKCPIGAITMSEVCDAAPVVPAHAD